ncbi:Fructosamine kinase-domain-containing protein [Xylaria curta]|nr:Fructosamine kinase-domain-containing protein [Xylaria curta]
MNYNSRGPEFGGYTEEHSVSSWANTGRINVQLADGRPDSFFIQVISGYVGKNMTRNELESLFTSVTSKQQIPRRKFGYHIATYSGNLPQMTAWETSWEVFFTKNLRLALELELAAKGPDPEFDVLLPIVFDTVIPRLLGPLESEGRSVKPCLVHGDLWYANSGIDDSTGESLIFDACCFYAHNEYEFGQWRPACNRFGPEYLEAYHDYVQISPPEEDYDGRLDLYKLRFNTHVSALFSDNQTLREQMLGDIRDLVRRYGNLKPGDTGYP